MMNIYDFDGTIYNGDSSIDFLKYSIKRNKKILTLMPAICVTYFLYLIKVKDKKFFKSKFFSFVQKIDNIDEEVKKFWKENEKKIKSFYLENKKEDDIIISASPYFLLEPICSKLEVTLIASNFDKKTGKLIGNNCYGEEKVQRLKQMGIEHCEKFYSDSKSDEPLKQIAKEAFIVKKNTITSWL